MRARAHEGLSRDPIGRAQPRSRYARRSGGGGTTLPTAISAASITKVPDPHIGSTSGSSPRNPHCRRNSAAIVSRGEYGVPEGLVSSFPVRAVDGQWQIVEGLEISAWSRTRIDASIAELLAERDAVRALGLL